MDILTQQPDGERRQVERKPLSVRVRMALQGKPEMEVRSVDISVGGMSLTLDINLVPGTPCQLSFSMQLPNGDIHKIQAEAAVAHCTYSSKRSGFVTGVQFKRISSDAQALVARYMKG